MRAACSASPVICVRRKRRTDRGAHACGRCVLRQAGCSFLSSGSRLLAWGGALGCGGFGCFPAGGAFLRTAYAFGCVGCARGGARCVGACGGFAFRQAGCSFLSSSDARCALRSALPRTAYAFGCVGCARGGARSGELERGPLCRPGEAQCADGRPTVAPREPTPRQGEIARCQRRDDARCLVPPSACAPRLPSMLPPCRVGCGCAAWVAPVPRGLRRARLLHSRCAPQGGPIGLSRSRRAARFAVVRRGLRRACLLHSRRAPQGALVFHSLRQIFSRCPH